MTPTESEMMPKGSPTETCPRNRLVIVNFELGVLCEGPYRCCDNLGIKGFEVEVPIRDVGPFLETFAFILALRELRR